jgi:hypothetical protein
MRDTMEIDEKLNCCADCQLLADCIPIVSRSIFQKVNPGQSRSVQDIPKKAVAPLLAVLTIALMKTQNQFGQWLRAMPAKANGEKTVLVNVTLPIAEWMIYARAASANGISLDEAVSHVLQARAETCDWEMEGFDLETSPRGL